MEERGQAGMTEEKKGKRTRPPGACLRGAKVQRLNRPPGNNPLPPAGGGTGGGGWHSSIINKK